MLDKKKVIVIVACLFVAMLATLVIIRNANVKYTQVAKTVDAYEAASFLPLRSTIGASTVTNVKVPASLTGLATNVTGKTLLVSVMPGDLIYQNELGGASALPQGMVSVMVPVNQASSDGVMPGDVVNVFNTTSGKTAQATMIAQNIQVIGAYDSQGMPVVPFTEGASSGVAGMVKGVSGSHIPAVVELMVPAGTAQGVVNGAKSIYLVREK